MDDSRSSGQSEIEHAAAFRAELRRFLARTETATGEAGLTPQRYDLLLAIKAAGGQATINDLDATVPAREGRPSPTKPRFTPHRLRDGPTERRFGARRRKRR